MKYCKDCGGISASFSGAFLKGILREGIKQHRLRCLLIPRIEYSHYEGMWVTHYPNPLGRPERDIFVRNDEYEMALKVALCWDPGRVREITS